VARSPSARSASELLMSLVAPLPLMMLPE